MGSPSSRLDTPEHLRQWVDSGLSYVLNSGGPEHSAPQQQVGQQRPQPQQQQVPVQQQTQQPTPQQQAQPQEAMGAAPTPQAQPQAPQPEPAPVLNTPNFPQPWAKFFNMAPPTPKVVWTYMELGLDLGGQSDPKRAAVLRNILGHHLKWPKGTAAFWPVAALDNGSLQPNSDMFWKGWSTWKTPYIACFGEEALRIIYPNAQPGNTTYLLEHVTIYVLPPLAKLITMLPHEQQLSVDVLTGVRID